jgi:flagellar protein FliT
MPSQITIYEEMKALSARMVDAARAHDWDELVSLETSVRQLRTALASTTESTNANVAEIERKRGLIEQILLDDAEVRRYTEPWMEHVRQFLGSHTMRREVQKAYAAGTGEVAVGSFGG